MERVGVKGGECVQRRGRNYADRTTKMGSKNVEIKGKKVRG